MSTKYLLHAIGIALLAAGNSLIESSENAPEEIAGITLESVTAEQVEAGEAELDASGLPWDERIHASTKTKTAKEIWTRRKNIADATYDAVIAELRVQYPEPHATPTPPVAAVAAPTLPSLAPPSAPTPPTPYGMLCTFLAKNTGLPGRALTKEWVDSCFAGQSIKLADLANDQGAAQGWLDAFRDALKQVNETEVA